MPVEFKDIALGQKLELPGRVGRPDRYEVVKLHSNRVVLESLLRKGSRRLFMSNQFDQAGFEKALEELEREYGE